jgi:fumarate reductase flavoprotein subunit
MKRKIGWTLLCCLGLGLLLSCAGSTGKNEYKPGVYTSRQQGHNGFIEVEVSFSQTAITGIKVVKSFETAGVSDKAMLTDLPEAIIAGQSLSVDTITGATVSSFAMLAFASRSSA